MGAGGEVERDTEAIADAASKSRWRRFSKTCILHPEDFALSEARKRVPLERHRAVRRRRRR